MIDIQAYIDEQGHKRFADWFANLEKNAAARVATALSRIEQGNFSNVKGVGGGVFEYKIDFGPGYRIYFGKDGERLVVLVGGGSKHGQSKDITTAKKCWGDYKRRKRQEVH